MSLWRRPFWASKTIWRRSRSLRSSVARNSPSSRSTSACGSWMRIIGYFLLLDVLPPPYYRARDNLTGNVYETGHSGRLRLVPRPSARGVGGAARRAQESLAGPLQLLRGQWEPEEF